MPRTSIDYSKTVIYKIVCNDLNVKELYVGSTTDFTRRKSQHKYVCNNTNDKGYDIKLYQIIRNNGGFENWSMIEIEKFPCNDGNEARARERQIYDELNASLNMLKPHVTDTELVEYKKQYDTQYRQNNKAKILEQNKHYRENNKQTILEYNKQYRLDNRSKVLVYRKNDYEKHKNDILENRSKTYDCECGSNCRISDKARHIKTKKHIAFIEKIISNNC